MTGHQSDGGWPELLTTACLVMVCSFLIVWTLLVLTD